MNELVAAFAILALIVAAGALLFAEIANDEARSLGRDLAAEIKRNVGLEQRLADLGERVAELEQRFGAQAPRRRGQDLPPVAHHPAAGLQVVKGADSTGGRR